ncbi:MAG: hypothetical protein JW750_06395 [Anaerolineaceae bacterium]|nr:hypothetical protein [Anaerolineaceae bacterium]
MELIALIILILIEIALAGYRMVTKSEQAKARAITRVGLLAGFVLLLVTRTVEWGARWYALSALLLVWALIATVRLAPKRVPEKEYHPRRVLRDALISILFVSAALAPAVVFPQHAPLPVTGLYGIDTAIYTFSDPNRVKQSADAPENRTVTVECWYPQTAGETYPLILFSHGAFGVRTSNVSLYRELASHGYVVCAVDHTDHSLYSRGADGSLILIDGDYMRGLSAENASVDPEGSYAYYQDWMAVRMGDLRFVIDTILARADVANADGLYRLVDESKIGVIGHSLGGSAALGMGRTYADIDAVMALEAPFMVDIIGVKDGKFVWNQARYPVPVLNVYSDSSWEHLGKWPQYAANARLINEPDANTHNAHLIGAGHLTLTDLSRTSPLLTRMLNGYEAPINAADCLTQINQLALAFFDHYLKGIGEFPARE